MVPNSLCQHSYRYKIFMIALCLAGVTINTGCVRHQGTVHIHDHSWNIIQDGKKITEDATFSSALPSETHVDAWYRDQQGYIHRAHVHLESSKPLWQRFPADILTDLMWPGDLQVNVEKQLLMRDSMKYSKTSLDRLANKYGFAGAVATINP